MTSPYRIHLARYSPKSGETRISGPVFQSFEDFHAATRHAEAMLVGMRAADPDSSFSIATISADGIRGVMCDGSRLFETAEELSQRVAPEPGK